MTLPLRQNPLYIYGHYTVRCVLTKDWKPWVQESTLYEPRSPCYGQDISPISHSWPHLSHYHKRNVLINAQGYCKRTL